MGATVYPDGVNFSLFSQAATEVVAAALRRPAGDRAGPDRFGSIRSTTRRFISGTCSSAAAVPGRSTRFASTARPIRRRATGSIPTRCSSARTPRASAGRSGSVPMPWAREDNLATSMRCAVVDLADYDWEGDRPLKRPIHESIIYEMHVGGFTRSPSAGVRHPGTFAGMIEKIPYLQALGVTAVELLPVCEFDDSRRVAQRRRARRFATTGATARSGSSARTPGYCVDRTARRAHQRVPRPGQGAAPGRHRGHPRRRLQPHRRGQRAGADRVVPRHRQPHVLSARPEQPRRVRELQRRRQHVQRESPAAAEVHRRLPAILGGGDARRRLPVRRRLDSRARRGRHAARRIRRSSGRSSSTMRWPTPR